MFSLDDVIIVIHNVSVPADSLAANRPNFVSYHFRAIRYRQILWLSNKKCSDPKLQKVVQLKIDVIKVAHINDTVR